MGYLDMVNTEAVIIPDGNSSCTIVCPTLSRTSHFAGVQDTSNLDNLGATAVHTPFHLFI